MLVSKLFLSALISSLILLFSCTQRPLIPKDNTNEAERNNHLFVFVGEKIEVKELKQDEDSWDGKFYARYKILQKVYGDYDGEFIEFTAYDHYGVPAFSNYENCLLFVSKHNNKFFQEKYQYYDVYKTKSNRWAGRYSVPDFGRDGGECYGVKPEKIDFQEPVSFLFSKMENQQEIDCWFPQPYYKLDSAKATAVYGNYIEDLFIIKKKGVLAYRGLFAPKPNDDLISTPEVTTAEIMVEDKAEYKRFGKFLHSLRHLADSSDKTSGFVFTLDTFLLNDNPAVQQDLFSRGIFSASLISKLMESDNIRPSIVYSDSIVTNTYLKKAAKISGGNLIARIEVIKERVRSNELVVSLEFVKTHGVYKLYSCNQFNHSICFR